MNRLNFSPRTMSTGPAIWSRPESEEPVTFMSKVTAILPGADPLVSVKVSAGDD